MLFRRLQDYRFCSTLARKKVARKGAKIRKVARDKW
jgi:hypothetical protein